MSVAIGNRRRWLGVRERVDFDQQGVGDLAESCGVGSSGECMRGLPDASVLGFTRMVGSIMQVPGDCCLYRFDQPAACRVTEARISFQGEIDIFGEEFDEMMRLGERCSALEDDCLAVVGFVEALYRVTQ